MEIIFLVNEKAELDQMPERITIGRGYTKIFQRIRFNAKNEYAYKRGL